MCIAIAQIPNAEPLLRISEPIFPPVQRDPVATRALASRLSMVIGALFLVAVGASVPRDAAAVPILSVTLRVPATGVFDNDITDLDEHSISNLSGSTASFHVGVPGGIDDMHILIRGGQLEGDPLFTQDMFPTQVITPVNCVVDSENRTFCDSQIDLFGQHYPFSTEFEITSNVSFDIRYTVPEPGNLALLAVGMVGIRLSRRNVNSTLSESVASRC